MLVKPYSYALTTKIINSVTEYVIMYISMSSPIPFLVGYHIATDLTLKIASTLEY